MADAPSITAPVTTGRDRPLRMEVPLKKNQAGSSRSRRGERSCRNVTATREGAVQVLLQALSLRKPIILSARSSSVRWDSSQTFRQRPSQLAPFGLSDDTQVLYSSGNHQQSPRQMRGDCVVAPRANEGVVDKADASWHGPSASIDFQAISHNSCPQRRRQCLGGNGRSLTQTLRRLHVHDSSFHFMVARSAHVPDRSGTR